MANKKNNWFDTHFEVITLDGNKKKEKKFKENILKAMVKDFKKNPKHWGEK